MRYIITVVSITSVLFFSAQIQALCETPSERLSEVPDNEYKFETFPNIKIIEIGSIICTTYNDAIKKRETKNLYVYYGSEFQFSFKDWNDKRITFTIANNRMTGFANRLQKFLEWSDQAKQFNHEVDKDMGSIPCDINWFWVDTYFRSSSPRPVKFAWNHFIIGNIPEDSFRISGWATDADNEYINLDFSIRITPGTARALLSIIGRRNIATKYQEEKEKLTNSFK